MLPYGYDYVVATIVLAVVFFVICCFYDKYHRRAEQQPAVERVARAWAELQALAAMAETVLAARDEAALTGQATAAPPVLLQLPYSPYAAQPQGDKQSETVVCAICLEPLRIGQLCSEVPLCHHVFHNVCLGEWARSNGSCPLCRAKIVPGSDEVAVADDMV